MSSTDKHMTEVHNTCTFCGKQNVVTVPTAGYQQWMAGSYIQDALPELSPDVREALMTGTHAKCWDEMFKEEDDD